MKIRITRHALERLFLRRISPVQCEFIISLSEVIESYPNDTPFPSMLYFGRVDDRNLHVVAAIDEKACHVITAYEPDTDLWEADFKTRKKTHN